MSDRRFGTTRDLTPLELALGVGLCVVPAVFALVAWGFGWRAGVAVALAVAMAITLACWVLCQGKGDRGRGA